MIYYHHAYMRGSIKIWDYQYRIYVLKTYESSWIDLLEINRRYLWNPYLE